MNPAIKLLSQLIGIIGNQNSNSKQAKIKAAREAAKNLNYEKDLTYLLYSHRKRHFSNIIDKRFFLNFSILIFIYCQNGFDCQLVIFVVILKSNKGARKAFL